MANRPGRELDRTGFASAATDDAIWHQRNKIDTELTKKAERKPQPPASFVRLNFRRVIRETRGGSSGESTTRRAAVVR
ncbi:hypothetical protein EVAR_54670_1 [Eumeta japonica]|uniref:Uncharacterized protein n=1 Tax=Eumeta variegata TaxID=151549 RepID=A0A4C1X561_EUMVA|nr:hypothetical protein EVAR_54670_1 [Eumeta japonica]